MLQEIKQVIFSRRFLGAACLMFVCLSGYAACDWIFVHDFDIAYRPSSLQLTLGGIFFGGTMLMIPLCAALPAGILQAEEVQTGMIEWKLIRSTIHRYTAAKFCGAFLGAGSAVCLAFFAHALLWNLLATPCDPSINEYLALPFAEDCIYAPWQSVCYSLPIYLWMAGGIFFCGGIWGIVSITAALYTRDKLLAIAIPFCIYFLWHYGLPGILLGIRPFPHPADLYNDALTVPMIWRSLMVYAVLLVATCGLYMSKLKRSYQHG